MNNPVFDLTPSVEPIKYEDGKLHILDQRELPHREVWLEIDTLTPLVDAIQELAVRGAPLLGIAAAYGVLVGLNELNSSTIKELQTHFIWVKGRIARTRPTARNLFYALECMEKVVDSHIDEGHDDLLIAIYEKARAIHQGEINNCTAIALNGAELFKNYKTILTHCNTGALATGGVGTALGVILAAYKKGYIEKVWVDETRPLLQGARLTTWELEKLGIPFNIICDSAAPFFIQQGEIDAVIVGADRIAANGDVANKIGTYSLAVNCKNHDVPFYVAAPTSTIDLDIPDSSGIKIEERNPKEVRGFRNSIWAPVQASARNPAFDITHASLVTGIITEKGVIQTPSRTM